MKLFLQDNLSLGDTIISKINDFGVLHIDDVTIARTGIQYYLESEILEDGDESKRVGVARLKEDVLDETSIQTFKNIPVTDNHPRNEFVTSKNFSKYQKGSISKVDTLDDAYLKTDIAIQDEVLIGKVKSGKVELSVGYSTVLIAEDGMINGEKYSYRQTEIKANHLAVVDFGRCGAKCSLVGDDGSLIILNKRKDMKIKIGDSNIEVDEVVAKHVSMLDTKVEVLEKELVDSKEREKTALSDAIDKVNMKNTLLDFAHKKDIKVDKTLSIFDTKQTIVKGLGYDVKDRDESSLDTIIEMADKYSTEVSDEKSRINDKKLPSKGTEDAELWKALKNTKIGGK